MQEGAMVAKGRLLWDGEEIPGLLRIGGRDIEQKKVTVSKYFEEFTLTANTRVIPEVEVEYVLERNTKTMQFFDDFNDNRETKTATFIAEDGDGVEYGRQLWLLCQVSKKTESEVNFGSLVAATYVITVAPQTIKKIKVA